jgi:nucleotide-binding universal stress UspA family protein
MPRVRRLVLGNVATEVLHRARLPMLLVVRSGRQVTTETLSTPDMNAAGAESMALLVPLDLTEKADAVLPEVARIARAADADIVLFAIPLGITVSVLLSALEQQRRTHELGPPLRSRALLYQPPAGTGLAKVHR